MVSNVIVEATEVEGEYDVHVTYLLYRTQKEKDVTIYCGKRHDKIRRVEGGLGFQIFNRKIVLDQVTYNSHNLSVSFVMNKIFVCQVDELDEGEALKVDCGVNGIEALAVFNNGGEFFAMNDRCSHGNASMSEGYLEDDGTVELPTTFCTFPFKDWSSITLASHRPDSNFPCGG